MEKVFQILAHDPDPTIKLNVKIAKTLLGQIDTASIPDLLQGLRTDHKKTSRLSQNALRSLAKKSPDKMLPALIEILKTGKKGFVLTNTLGLLRIMKTAAGPALPYIIPLYSKDDPVLREDTLATLASVDKTGDQSIPVLVKALKDSDHLVRREALYGLLMYRDKVDQHMDEIVKLLSDKSIGNVMQTLDFVSSLGAKGRKATPEVLKLMTHKNRRVRLRAARTLGNIAEPSDEVIKALQAELQDKDIGLQKQAIIALKRLEEQAPKKVLPILRKELNNGSNKASVLESITSLGPKGKDAVPDILKVASDDNAKVRLKAIQALGGVASPTEEVLKTLQQALSDKNLGVRKQAVIALELLGASDENKVVPILIEALRNENDRIVKGQITTSLQHLAREKPAPRSDASPKKSTVVR